MFRIHRIDGLIEGERLVMSKEEFGELVDALCAARSNDVDPMLVMNERIMGDREASVEAYQESLDRYYSDIENGGADFNFERYIQMI